jgi:hypothetical protein
MIKSFYAIYNPKLSNYYNPITKEFRVYNTNAIYDKDTALKYIDQDGLKGCELKIIYKYFKS